MLQVIQHTHEKHNVEVAVDFRRKVVNILHAIFDARTQQFTDHVEVFDLGAIDGHYFGAAALHFEGEVAVPSADVEDTFAIETSGNREIGGALAEFAEWEDSIEHPPVRQLNAVIETFLRELVHQHLVDQNVRG